MTNFSFKYPANTIKNLFVKVLILIFILLYFNLNMYSKILNLIFMAHYVNTVFV